MAWNDLDLADFLLIAEAVLDLPAEQLLKAYRIDLAESALHAPAAEFGGRRGVLHRPGHQDRRAGLADHPEPSAA